MAIVSSCTYDARGRLIQPDRLAIGHAKISFDLDTGGCPTFDRGRVHVHVMTASGLTAAQAHQRANVQLERFLERAEDVAGYREIVRKEIQGTTPCNGNTVVTYEILYAVEAPMWARHRGRAAAEARFARNLSVVAGM
ncbi:hypothetical protein [Amycolatopsis sp. CA-230715]|uniref:hypothetical protein n=1 Tax=Amycolatopsis sp. CA-230715 TaxID=2745196 RepID=UPI001C0234E4|nr:hypothetical protein [Amycolatopsis sp. CA-230715]QWF85717.1 hypothetical protein HUW46_09197 [Amycolatopsis sp. CA-230715]